MSNEKKDLEQLEQKTMENQETDIETLSKISTVGSIIKLLLI